MSQPLPISFTRRAAKQTEAAGRWWRENRTKAPEALREELEQALQLIARIVANPLTFPQVHGQTPWVVLARFPYAIYFRIDRGDVVVLAVHGRQDPTRWQARS